MYEGKVGMHKQVKCSERGHKTLIFACLLYLFKNPSLNCQKADWNNFLLHCLVLWVSQFEKEQAGAAVLSLAMFNYSE